MTARVGAVHLGWDVVSVAAGGGGTPIRPVQVEGTYTPPAYLLADASGRLHTSGAERGRPDLGIAIADVRDVLGHHQIRIAGATWPVELVFRARLYNPLAAVGKHLRGKPDVVALPYPDDWPDEKVDEYCRVVELLDVITEPLPESVALSGYVRALGLVQPADGGRRPVGATGVYSDGRMCLVVAVHGDDEQPTESVGVPIAPDAMREAQSADNVVIEVMAAARSIGADTSTVLLTGNICFNDALRLAFQNHLGHRLRVADHPMHALVLGAAHLLVTDSEYPDDQYPPGPPPGHGGPPPPAPRGPQGPPGPGGSHPGSPYGTTGPHVQPGPGRGGPSVPGPPGAAGPTGSLGQGGQGPLSNPGPGIARPPADPGPPGAASNPNASRGGSGGSGNADSPGVSGSRQGAPENPGHGVSGVEQGISGAESAAGRTVGTSVSGGGRHALPTPGTPTPAARGTANPGMAAPARESGRHSWRPPESASVEAAPQLTGTVDQGPRHIAAHAQPLQRQPEPLARQPELVPRHVDPPPSEGRHAARDSGERGGRFTRPPADEVTTVLGRRPESTATRSTDPWTPPAAPERDDEEGDQRRGKLWGKVKDNLFGTPTIVGAVALAAVAIQSGGEPERLARPADAVASVDAPVNVDSAAPPADGAASFDVRSAAVLGERSDFGAWPAVERASRVRPTVPECALTQHARPDSGPRSIGDAPGCARLGIDNLRYLVPTLPGIDDVGPPMHA
ncbi:hypothetical protein NDR87_19370 [Nocardia sp. CDC159]|uniref:Uncharacterized protein n=1 Tax=Nocardia pulmonis TaxID=2951408 RepID=A0A9X2E8L3_9NOCA|nr:MULTISPECIES: hypothetical protein [Nocardia]MCM6776147.1 hypothetical protein [Nocardia pulmonis]MCM6788526.1 hypothetical protein [Nocardia sp. CDC159]